MGKRNWQEKAENKLTGISGRLPTRTSHFHLKGKKNAIQCLPPPFEKPNLGCGGSLPQLGISRPVPKPFLVGYSLIETSGKKYQKGEYSPSASLLWLYVPLPLCAINVRMCQNVVKPQDKPRSCTTEKKRLCMVSRKAQTDSLAQPTSNLLRSLS